MNPTQCVNLWHLWILCGGNPLKLDCSLYTRPIALGFMSQTNFSTEWLQQFSDPYATLGISVTVDDRRVLKRYRFVAKQLHPDVYANNADDSKEFANQLLARLINPAYQRLKQEKGRAEMMANLRFRVRRMTRDQALTPDGEWALKLMKTPPPSLDINYEQAVTALAEKQFQDFAQFEAITQELAELNLVYLQLKMGEPLVREKRSGVVPAAEAKPIQFTPVTTDVDRPEMTYAQRHCQRARQYLKRQNWSMAMQELRDAIRLEPKNSEYHALLAKSYLMQNLPGMAKVHFRQALSLDPKNPIALQYVKTLNIKLDSPAKRSLPKQPKNAKSSDRNSGLFGGLFAKKQ